MDIFQFVHSFIPLINSHSNDFLIADLWHNFLPDTVQSQLNSIDNPEIILNRYLTYCDSASPFNPKSINSDIPWSDLIDPSEGVIDRRLLPNWDVVSADLDNYLKICAGFSRFSAFSDAKNAHHNDNFIDHEMNPKKSYEVAKMSSVCSSICRDCQINQIVDIGSGRGYLGTDLSVTNGYNVIELDSKQSNSASALKRRQRFLRQRNLPPDSAIGSCRSIVRCVTPGDTVGRILADEGCGGGGGVDYLLTGLHCCGGLSSVVLRSFVADGSDARAVAIVGCCYHLLAEAFVGNFPHEAVTEATADFPMSAQLRGAGVALGRNARTFASQSVRRIAIQPALHQSMFHRVLLQRLLYDKVGSASDDWVVGKISKKMANVDSFEEYAHLACHKLGLGGVVDSMTTEDFVEYEERFPELRHRFTCFFYLKCCMSAIIENIIVWDRLLFLREHGISESRVLELFDEVRSPRRYALVGVK